MELYSENEYYKLYNGNMLDMLDVIEPNSIGSIVTDPPYELNFMGKGWDNAGVSFNKNTWEKCLQVLKPGGYLLAFGGSRTYHRIACAIEDAGFEIRDTIMWLYGSGFPKSMNLGLAIDKKNGVESEVIGVSKSGSKESHTRSLNLVNSSFGGEYAIKQAQNKWQGWGTCLKPSFEPIIIARKPFKGSLVDNVLENGVGGLNIDECRVEFKNGETNSSIDRYNSTPQKGNNGWEHKNRGANFNDTTIASMKIGRFPANTILTYDDTDYDEVCSGFPTSDKPNGSISKQYKINNMVYGDYGYCNTWEAYQDCGSASRYFYCAKASKKDRDEGLDEIEEQNVKRKNIHPTVKPTNLMQYLVRLVTPQNGTVLDPFNGSGSTGKAVMYENLEKNKDYKYIGIEMTEDYLPISKARIEYVTNKLNMP